MAEQMSLLTTIRKAEKDGNVDPPVDLDLMYASMVPKQRKDLSPNKH
jgi:hypothetical protein